MAKCTFCEIYANKDGLIYDVGPFFARFDKFPVSPGHVEVIPKRHVVSLTDLTEQELINLKPAISETLDVIKGTDLEKLYRNFINNPPNDKSIEFYLKMLAHIGINKEMDAYNLGINEGEAAGRTIHHLHIHLIPRFDGDVEDHIGGVRHIIPGMGNYKK